MSIRLLRSALPAWALSLLIPAICSAAVLATDSTAVADTAVVTASAGPGPYPEVPYRSGEKLEFSIDYGPVNAGDASLEVKGVIESGGEPCYNIESRVRSNRFFSAFYMVRDKVITHVERRSLTSRYFAKRLREGDYRKNVALRFDQVGGKAYYADGRVFDILPGTHDILSAFYFVRTLELAPGDTTLVTTYSSRKSYLLKVIVHRRETVEVPAGTFDCVVVEPVIVGEGLFQFEGKLTIWMTDDERHMPVLMRTKVKVGAIDASLKGWSPGTDFALGDGE